MYDPLFDLPWWGSLLVFIALTQITIAGVTIFLHRNQAHRALDLHPIVSHFFRLWLWMTTGMVTREWVAIHRKHHAKVETKDDPHSPVVKGINKVLWGGVLLYRKEAENQETMNNYGHDTPNDWLERNIYSPWNKVGILILMAIYLTVFGLGLGLLFWIIHMLWIPFWAAGVVNGIGHYWGYRNFEVKDASTNIIPWAFWIGGEELHNNHHTYPSSAKFSVKPWEFDIAWLYIRLMSMVGLAKVRKVAPKPVYDTEKTTCDIDTVKAVIRNRFQIMSRFTRDVLSSVCREELQKADPGDHENRGLLKRARRLLKKAPERLSENSQAQVNQILKKNTTLETVYSMKKKLQDVWQRSATTQDNLLHALEEWCRQAEATGIQALRDFSRKLRTYSLAPA